MIRPHGGELVNRIVKGSKKERLLEESREVLRIDVDEEMAQEVRNIAIGRYSPLNGFQNQNNFLKVVRDMRTETGEAWTIPMTLDVKKDISKNFNIGDSIALFYNEKPLAIVDVNDIYTYDRDEVVESLYGTVDINHPGVRMYSEKEDVFVGGKVNYLRGIEGNRNSKYDLTPRETRVFFKEMGWKSVVGFQTRNAPHRGHEYLQKNILENVDGILIHPKIGKKKIGDYRDEVIIEAYNELMGEYYLRNNAVLCTLPTKMRYMGPREAVFDILIRKNQGCTHFIVGRDHAGVGNYYGEFESQEIFQKFPDIQIEPLFYDYAFYCEKCHGMVSDRTCPHGSEQRLAPSGTKIRGMLKEGKIPPKELMRPEVAEKIMEFNEPFVKEEDLGGVDK
ncbi:MAG: sulfate adenylyltransferase [Candidatus Aenigmatarchaeota archaeon]